MWLLWALLASGSGVLYQTASKSLSAHLSPFVYAGCIGFTITIASASIVGAQMLNGQKPALPTGSLWGWLALGALAGATIDIATFLMYKNGAPFSVARTLIGASTAVLVLITGILLFKEHVVWQQIAGIALCVAGLLLITLYRS